ncbi:MAG: hypothetical protein PF501_17705 [Salinisphaera sp.]|jgi:predicted DNA binding CopG/RHH family protein|nr:hypothetical protein [Salinisphaera sp.]
MTSNTKLTAEEQDILGDYDRDEFESVLTPETRQAHIDAARQTFRKDKRVNIRMSGQDVELLQERALQEGIPYQTLMSSVLHKFVNGRFVERDVRRSPTNHRSRDES